MDCSCLWPGRGAERRSERSARGAAPPDGAYGILLADISSHRLFAADLGHPEPGANGARAPLGCDRGSDDRPGRGGVWSQHRLRLARTNPHSNRTARRAAAQSRAVPLRGRRSVATRGGGAAHPGAEGRESRPGVLGRTSADPPRACPAARDRHLSVHSEQGLGRRPWRILLRRSSVSGRSAPGAA
jgi:hypothetical protein